MSELVEAVQKAVRREVAQVLRQAADVVDGNGAEPAWKGALERHNAVADSLARHVDPGLTGNRVRGRVVKRGRPQGVGFRHQQVLDLLKKHPEGLGGADIAKRCRMQGKGGRSSTQVYGVLKRLQRAGEVKKRGKVYVAA